MRTSSETRPEAREERPSFPQTGGLAGWQKRLVEAAARERLAELTVGKLADEVRLSRYWFSRAFRSSYGIPPAEWLQDRRLREAERRLRVTDDTVERIALDVGYRSGSQLARMFRRRMGASPSVWRRR
ncbi:MAG: helix-turn-helix transcriptional regulator [Alphaproteobacteria bacterium]|jgi:AraC family transcriptional regulator|nr:helix-turn-helix transcriptional regulator [Alphaproteobacteria bacterium]MBU1525913.1 helix-turn-helix transcriptional regulator [Alphaproteobacteria bacterium]MBU2116576.1 helix-turn-helix transcriptional regulator [Alphaproteobacteria bacterium]MBU2352042.1 helix-turn-helix transcriptional regulator [Alphaproteobacteria bacterium]MBU2381112.1 helix-turn-helix transcriptional regulator [Alphaproteobacteria bacterium]